MVKRRATVRRKRHPNDQPFWYSWRHIAAYVYLTICVFDFIGMPIFYEVVNPRTSDAELVSIVMKLEPAAQVQALTILHNERTWESLTLAQGGLFHMAFGAILGVAAFTRGQEKVWNSRSHPYYEEEDHMSEPFPEPEEPVVRGRRSRRVLNEEPPTPDPFNEEFEPEPEIK